MLPKVVVIVLMGTFAMAVSFFGETELCYLRLNRLIDVLFQQEKVCTGPITVPAELLTLRFEVVIFVFFRLAYFIFLLGFFYIFVQNCNSRLAFKKM